MPALLAALSAGGCGGAADPPPVALTTTRPQPQAVAPAPGRPALCAGLRARIAGRIGASAATELSGLVLSRSQPGVLWTHNDSGDRARLLAVSTAGRLLADVSLTGAENVDWEDIAIDRGTLLIGDIGDNLAQRESISVYRVAEPRAGGGASTPAVTAARIDLRYPDGARDAEALLVDPASGALVIVEKSFSGRAGVYVATRPSAAGARVTMRRRGRLSLGPAEAVTAGDVSADGRTIALRTYTSVFVWVRRRQETVAAALRRAPCSARADLIAEGQGETLALSRGGDAFYTVPEGSRPAIRRYAPDS